MNVKFTVNKCNREWSQTQVNSHLFTPHFRAMILVRSVYEIMPQFLTSLQGLSLTVARNLRILCLWWTSNRLFFLLQLHNYTFVTILTQFYILYLELINIQCYVPANWPQWKYAFQALNCLITCSIGALQIGHGSPLCFKTCAQGQQQQQCPVSPWMSVAFLGCSMQIIHLLLTSVSSGKATVFPFSVTKDGLASAADVGVKRSLVIQGFSSGLRLKLKPARIGKKNKMTLKESRGL